MDLVPYCDREHGSYFENASLKVGHMRCYFTGGNEVMSSFIPAGNDLQKQMKMDELIQMTEEITRGEIMRSFNSMKLFCMSHPEARTGDISSDEYTFFSEREFFRYWIRFILRRGDYNCYIHCYVKELTTDGL